MEAQLHASMQLHPYHIQLRDSLTVFFQLALVNADPYMTTSRKMTHFNAKMDVALIRSKCKGIMFTNPHKKLRKSLA